MPARSVLIDRAAIPVGGTLAGELGVADHPSVCHCCFIDFLFFLSSFDHDIAFVCGKLNWSPQTVSICLLHVESVVS